MIVRYISVNRSKSRKNASLLGATNLVARRRELWFRATWYVAPTDSVFLCLCGEKLMIVLDIFMRHQHHEAGAVAHHRFDAIVVEALAVEFGRVGGA